MSPPPTHPYMKSLTHPGANMDIKHPPNDESLALNEVMEGTADPIIPTPSALVKKSTPKEKASEKDWLSDELLVKLEAHRPPHSLKAGDKVPHDLCHSAFSALFSPLAKPMKGEYEYENIHQAAQAVRHVAHWYGFSTKVHGTTISCCCSMNTK